MKQCEEEGIVLQAMTYKESSRILTVFTKKAGMISLLAKHKKGAKWQTSWSSLLTPLCQGAFLYEIRRSSLYRLTDGHVVNLHLPLRDSYAHLTAGGRLARAVYQSQMQGKPAPLLYQLLAVYLAKLPSAACPSAFVASFLLKLLKHDGLICLSPTCLRCRQKPSRSLQSGESLCAQCAHLPSALFFSQKQWEDALFLESARKISPLTTMTLPGELHAKIESLFAYFFPSKRQ